MQSTEMLFALDIGTRSVVGVILEKKGNSYKIINIFSKEHNDRSMIDGQIHDVLSVSETIMEVKEQLEKQHGPLNKACVAAAGRSLKTEIAKASVKITNRSPLTTQDILHLELTAVQTAQASVADRTSKEQTLNLYCVGYSVLHYKLDHDEIGSLLDQQGHEASVEIIATFLPNVVVESLISALSRAKLEIEALTLEPIAAINALIPPSMRKLNIALIDVGAGTSDIAISDKGTVIGYGMVPLAGDEVTEAISEAFLLDFSIAEKAKRELHHNEKITVTNILGKDTFLLKSEVINEISPILEKIATEICKEILTLNNQSSPKAVMLVGGGSLTPDLQNRLQEKLSLSDNRIAVVGLENIPIIECPDHMQSGPEFVTPIGIALTAKNSPIKYRTVYINDLLIRLFEIKKLTVGDCLLSAGISIEDLYGKPGEPLFVFLNEKPITLPGGQGEPPLLLLNDSPCSFNSLVSNGNQIIVEKGRNGQSCHVQVKDLLDPIKGKAISINQVNYKVQPMITCNGVHVDGETEVKNLDKIEYELPATIEDLLVSLELKDLLHELKPFHFKLNGRDTFLPRFYGKLLKNGKLAKAYDKYDTLDKIEIQKRPSPTINDLASIKKLALRNSISVSFNGKKVTLEKMIIEFYRGQTLLSEDAFIYFGDELIMKEKEFIFQDLLKKITFEIPKVSRGSFVLIRNGAEAKFEDKIEPGDYLSIVWRHQQPSKK